MKKPINWVETSTLISTFATFLLVSFTFLQISRYANSMKADFAHKVKIDFFNDEERTIMYLLNNNLLDLKFYSNHDSSVCFPYFKIDKKAIQFYQNDSIKILSQIKDTYSTYEIEDLILNHFEDLNLYRKNNVVSGDYIYNGFSFYIESVFENPQIQKLLEWLNSGPGINDSYLGFRELYEYVQDYNKKKNYH